MSLIDIINRSLGPICTFIICCIFLCGVVIPMIKIFINHNRQDTDDEAELWLEIIQLPDEDVMIEALPGNDGIDVHDHTVQGSLVKSFLKLQEKTTVKGNYLNDIKKAIFAYADTDIETSEKAYSTLRTMMKFNGRLESIHTDELTVLNMVWARIQDPINEKARPDLIVSLIRQLAEASMTLDISRCVSGRIARIIQSLEAIDTEDVVNIASTEDIRRELSDKVPALLARVADQDDIKDFVDKELRKDYVLTDLLTETEYTKIVKDYLDAID